MQRSAAGLRCHGLSGSRFTVPLPSPSDPQTHRPHPCLTPSTTEGNVFAGLLALMVRGLTASGAAAGDVLAVPKLRVEPDASAQSSSTAEWLPASVTPITSSAGSCTSATSGLQIH